MEWLLKNKDWFFSGAGLAIISAVIYVIRRIYQWRTQRQGPATEATTTATIAGTRPYPSEITDAIRVSPALHQKTRGKEYVGLEV